MKHLYFLGVFTLLLSCSYLDFNTPETGNSENHEIVTEEPQKPEILPKPEEKSEDLAKARVDLLEIQNLAGKSSCAKYSWKNRGVGYNSYFKGMATVYVKQICNLDDKFVKLAAQKRFQPESQYDSQDALSWYNSNFRNAGLNNDTSGVSTLRNLYTLMLGSGMRESSGKYCEGRDKAASNTQSQNAEAGLFQTSYDSQLSNSHPGRQDRIDLYNKYKADQSSCLRPVFAQGVTCQDYNLKNWGDPNSEGYRFQELSKSCPAFATEYHALMLRYNRRHYGPINNKAAELYLPCNEMLSQIESRVKANPTICKEAVWK